VTADSSQPLVVEADFGTLSARAVVVRASGRTRHDYLSGQPEWAGNLSGRPEWAGNDVLHRLRNRRNGATPA
jgi:hypothetical protein